MIQNNILLTFLIWLVDEYSTKLNGVDKIELIYSVVGIESFKYGKRLNGDEPAILLYRSLMLTNPFNKFIIS